MDSRETWLELPYEHDIWTGFDIRNEKHVRNRFATLYWKFYSSQAFKEDFETCKKCAAGLIPFRRETFEPAAIELLTEYKRRLILKRLTGEN